MRSRIYGLFSRWVPEVIPPELIDKTFVPLRHFYSPFPDPDEAIQASKRAKDVALGSLPGIEINDVAMLSLFERLLPFMEAAPFLENAGSKYRYHYKNDFYGRGDGLIYFAMIGLTRPNRIVEIGSGYTSALALDAFDHFGLVTELTCIEPNTWQLKQRLREGDGSRIKLHEAKIQDIPISEFGALEAGDILFIDSSHVLKTGSDVCYELFEIIPSLKPGVLIHFHDVFFPFEYPHRWAVDEDRAWNEVYAIRAFLSFNTGFRIEFFNNYFGKKFRSNYNGPTFFTHPGGALWLRRSGD